MRAGSPGASGRWRAASRWSAPRARGGAEEAARAGPGGGGAGAGPGRGPGGVQAGRVPCGQCLPRAATSWNGGCAAANRAVAEPDAASAGLWRFHEHLGAGKLAARRELVRKAWATSGTPRPTDRTGRARGRLAPESARRAPLVLVRRTRRSASRRAPSSSCSLPRASTERLSPEAQAQAVAQAPPRCCDAPEADKIAAPRPGRRGPATSG